MKKQRERGKQFACLTQEEQHMYDMLPPKQRAYVEYRAQGHNKTEAFIMAGYADTKNKSQAAHQLEVYKKDIPYLIEKISASLKGASMIVEGTPSYNLLDKKAEEDYPEDLLEGEYTDVIPDNTGVLPPEKIDGEQARRIKLYRDIATGRVVMTKKRCRYNKEGEVLDWTEEKIDDPRTRIEARKALDKILGLSGVVELGSITAGNNVTINIVDASKREDETDTRDTLKGFSEVEEENGD